jgi:hypothetical protein
VSVYVVVCAAVDGCNFSIFAANEQQREVYGANRHNLAFVAGTHMPHARTQEEGRHLNQFIAYAALDMVEDVMMFGTQAT